MNNYEPWIITAREYLETAKLALGAGYHGPAYFNAAHSGELALKSLLVNLDFSENSIKSHNEIDLFDRIKSSGKYPKELIEEIEPLIKPFAEDPFYNIPHTDVWFDNGESRNYLRSGPG